ncbi:MAG: hypothetical protein O7C39_05210 [Bacteroidetes bacterium]|nr:hypothetical protein [Bacteroidota bacterium]
MNQFFGDWTTSVRFWFAQGLSVDSDYFGEFTRAFDENVGEGIQMNERANVYP